MLEAVTWEKLSAAIAVVIGAVAAAFVLIWNAISKGRAEMKTAESNSSITDLSRALVRAEENERRAAYEQAFGLCWQSRGLAMTQHAHKFRHGWIEANAKSEILRSILDHVLAGGVVTDRMRDALDRRTPPIEPPQVPELTSLSPAPPFFSAQTQPPRAIAATS